MLNFFSVLPKSKTDKKEEKKRANTQLIDWQLKLPNSIQKKTNIKCFFQSKQSWNHELLQSWKTFCAYIFSMNVKQLITKLDLNHISQQYQEKQLSVGPFQSHWPWNKVKVIKMRSTGKRLMEVIIIQSSISLIVDEEIPKLTPPHPKLVWIKLNVG